MDAEWRTRTRRGGPSGPPPENVTENPPPTTEGGPEGPPLCAGEEHTVPVFASQQEALAAIRVDIGEDCSRCKLHTLGRKQIVFGVGNPNADLMFVGEAPGADE